MALKLMNRHPKKEKNRLPKKEKSVINNHIFHNATTFAVSVNEDQERLPTFYWLPKLSETGRTTI